MFGKGAAVSCYVCMSGVCEGGEGGGPVGYVCICVCICICG